MKKILSIAFVLIFLSSCSITKMRYSKGYNIQLFSKYENAEGGDKQIKTKTNVKPIAKQDIASNRDLTVNPASKPDLETFRSETSKPAKIKTHKISKLITNVSSKISKPFTPKSKQGANTVHGDGSGVWGILGLTFAILGLLFPLILIFSILGLIFSAIGMGGNQSLRGLAIAGFIISLVVLIIVLLAIASL